MKYLIVIIYLLVLSNVSYADDFPKSLYKSIKKSIDNGNIDDAEDKIASNNEYLRSGRYLYLKGYLFEKKNKPDNAIHFYYKAILINKSNKLNREIKIRLARLMYDNKNYLTASILYHDIARKINFRDYEDYKELHEFLDNIDAEVLKTVKFLPGGVDTVYVRRKEILTKPDTVFLCNDNHVAIDSLNLEKNEVDSLLVCYKDKCSRLLEINDSLRLCKQINIRPYDVENLSVNKYIKYYSIQILASKKPIPLETFKLPLEDIYSIHEGDWYRYYYKRFLKFDEAKRVLRFIRKKVCSDSFIRIIENGKISKIIYVRGIK